MQGKNDQLYVLLHFANGVVLSIASRSLTLDSAVYSLLCAVAPIVQGVTSRPSLISHKNRLGYTQHRASIFREQQHQSCIRATAGSQRLRSDKEIAE